MELLEIVDVGERLIARLKEAFACELFDSTEGEPGQLVKVKFGVILKSPERAVSMSDANLLDCGEGIP